MTEPEQPTNETPSPAPEASPPPAATPAASGSRFPRSLGVFMIAMLPVLAGFGLDQFVDLKKPSLNMDSLDPKKCAVTIAGRVEDESGVDKVEIFIDEQIWATASISDGKFHETLHLSLGEHTVGVKVYDLHGNITERVSGVEILELMDMPPPPAKDTYALSYQSVTAFYEADPKSTVDVTVTIEANGKELGEPLELLDIATAQDLAGFAQPLPEPDGNNNFKLNVRIQCKAEDGTQSEIRRVFYANLKSDAVIFGHPLLLEFRDKNFGYGTLSFKIRSETVPAQPAEDAPVETPAEDSSAE